MLAQGSQADPTKQKNRRDKAPGKGKRRARGCEAQGREGKSREAKIRVGKAWGRHKGEEATRGDAQ